jgi:integrating conjugative element protein (TIGR03756 family)
MKKILCLILSILALQPAFAKGGGQVNFGTIALNVMQAVAKDPMNNFMNWRITGVCIWEHWTIFGPYFTNTWEVNEFLPDALVSVFYPNENPLDYENDILDPILKAAGDKIAQSVIGMTPETGDENASNHNDGTVPFKEVDIIGDPIVHFVENLFPSMLIPSVATSYMPYYSSLLDSLAWRDPEVELATHPQDLLINIGGADDWGALYPRNGNVDQAGDFKAAAVVALRAADIATITGIGHIYKSLWTGTCGEDCTIEPNEESHVNDFGQVEYQEIYPTATTSAEQTFGVEDPVVGTYNQDQYDKGGGDYLWVMWRHYSGCIQGGGDLFDVINF